MGILNTYFLASDDDAAVAAVGPTGPSGFNSRGITPVELDTLYGLLSGQDFSDLLSTMPDPLGDLSGEEEQWTMPLRPELTEALARLSSDETNQVGTAWVTTEELAGTPPEAAAQLLGELSALARQALERQQRLYLWMSL